MKSCLCYYGPFLPSPNCFVTNIFGAESSWTFPIGEGRGFPGFCDWKSILAPDRGYCHDDCFVVGVHMCVAATSATVHNTQELLVMICLL